MAQAPDSLEIINNIFLIEKGMGVSWKIQTKDLAIFSTYQLQR
jgi:hypothetical protein